MIGRILIMLALWACGAVLNYLGISLMVESFGWLGGYAIAGSAGGVLLVVFGIATILAAVFAVSVKGKK